MSIPQYGGIPSQYNGVLSAAPVPTGPAAANLAPPPQPAAEPEVPKGIPNQKTQTSQPTPGDVLDSLGNWATHLGTPTGDGLAQAVAHPGDALGAAKDAAGAVVNYPGQAVREPLAGVFAKQLESGDRSSATDLPIPTPDISKVPVLGFVADGPLGVAKGVAVDVVAYGAQGAAEGLADVLSYSGHEVACPLEGGHQLVADGLEECPEVDAPQVAANVRERRP